MNFDLHYFLMHAYDRLGRRMLPDTWTGNEISAYEPEPLEERRAKRAPLEVKLSKIDDLIEALKVEKSGSLKQDVKDRCNSKIKTLISERIKVSSQLSEIGEIDKHYLEGLKEIERRDLVKQELCRALEAQEFELSFPSGFNLRWEQLSKEPGYGFSIRHSLVRLPVERYGRNNRHYAAVIIREKFDKWLETHHPAPAKPDTPEARLQEFEQWFRQHLAKGGVHLRKPDVIEIGKEKFQLSELKAISVWNKLAPNNWKNAGRISDSTIKKIVEFKKRLFDY